MIILEELFKNLTEFRQYAPYSETNIEFKDLNSSASSARKQICIIISKKVYDIIVKREGEIHDALLTAMANLTLASSANPTLTYTSMKWKLCADLILRIILAEWIL